MSEEFKTERQANTTVGKSNQREFTLNYKVLNLKLERSISQQLIELFTVIVQIQRERGLQHLIIGNLKQKICKISNLLKDFIKRKHNFSSGVMLTIIMAFTLILQLMDCESLL